MEKASVSPFFTTKLGAIVIFGTDNRAIEKYGAYVRTVLTFLVFHSNYLPGM